MDQFIGSLIVGLGGLSILAYLPLQVLALARLRGMWRIGALTPAALMAFLFVGAILALLQGSNLWPIWLIFVSPPVCGVLLLLLYLGRDPHSSSTCSDAQMARKTGS